MGGRPWIVPDLESNKGNSRPQVVHTHDGRPVAGSAACSNPAGQRPRAPSASASADLLHDAQGFLTVDLGIGLRDSGAGMSEDDAGDVQTELLPEPGRGAVAELMRVPAVGLAPSCEIPDLLRSQVLPVDPRERRMRERP